MDPSGRKEPAEVVQASDDGWYLEIFGTLGHPCYREWLGIPHKSWNFVGERNIWNTFFT